MGKPRGRPLTKLDVLRYVVEETMRLRRAFVGLAALPFILAAPLSAAGCAEREGGPRELTVPELAAMMDGDATVALFDADGSKVRKQYGILPGAKLLLPAGVKGWKAAGRPTEEL